MLPFGYNKKYASIRKQYLGFRSEAKSILPFESQKFGNKNFTSV